MCCSLYQFMAATYKPKQFSDRTLFMTFNGAFIGLVPGKLIGDVILLVRKLRGCS